MGADGRFAPSPTGDAARGQPAHSAARLAGRAAAGRALPRAHGGPRHRARPPSTSRAAGRPGRARARLGRRRSCASPSAARATTRRSRGCEADGRLYPCWCTRREIREAASAPHGELPEGAYPGTCRGLTRGASGPSARRRAPAGAARRAPDAARVAFADRCAGRSAGVVDDFVVRRNDGASAYNLAVVVDDAEQGVGEVVRGDDLLDVDPAPAAGSAGCSGLPRPPTPTCRSCSAPDGERWPSATAP